MVQFESEKFNHLTTYLITYPEHLSSLADSVIDSSDNSMLFRWTKPSSDNPIHIPDGCLCSLELSNMRLWYNSSVIYTPKVGHELHFNSCVDLLTGRQAKANKVKMCNGDGWLFSIVSGMYSWRNPADGLKMYRMFRDSKVYDLYVNVTELLGKCIECIIDSRINNIMDRESLLMGVFGENIKIRNRMLEIQKDDANKLLFVDERREAFSRYLSSFEISDEL